VQELRDHLRRVDVGRVREYPARALTREAGEWATRLRIQATETGFDRIEGRSSVRTLAAGSRFTPYEVAHPTHVS
jgi:type VI secretion system secreted protein VgrG